MTTLEEDPKEGSQGSTISIYGLPGLHLTHEILETVSTSKGKNVLFESNTNLMIDQAMVLRKLTCLLKNHIDHFYWFGSLMSSEDPEKQEIAPLNAILDLLDSNSNGAFETFEIPKSLLLKSNWVQRLGGRAEMKASSWDVLKIAHTETGLEWERDDEEESEDGGEEDQDEDGEEEDHDEDGEEGDQDEDE